MYPRPRVNVVWRHESSQKQRVVGNRVWKRRQNKFLFGTFRSIVYQHAFKANAKCCSLMKINRGKWKDHQLCLQRVTSRMGRKNQKPVLKTF